MSFIALKYLLVSHLHFHDYIGSVSRRHTQELMQGDSLLSLCRYGTSGNFSNEMQEVIRKQEGIV